MDVFYWPLPCIWLRKPDVILKKKWFFLFISVAFLQIAFSCYQVLAFVYVAAVAAFFLVTDIRKSFHSQTSASPEKSVLTKKQASKENVSSKHLKASHLEDSFKAQLSFIGFHILVFLIGLAAHWIIAKLFYMSAGDYLGDQIAWHQAWAKGRFFPSALQRSKTA